MSASVRRCAVCHVAYPGNERFCSIDGGAIVEIEAAEAGSRVGQTIDGRYLVRRMLGRGGMGEVYEADHVGLDKRVAIKFITSDNKNPNALARFRREARVASKIVHEHVVQIFDVGSDTGGDYIVMEYLEGKDLKQVLADGKLSIERAVSIARQMLAGLAAIHDASILHRDIKPANVLLTTRGDERDFVKIMDFGISKSITGGDDGLTLTGTGNVIGTPEYIAPETLRGQDSDHRGDLYAVGITLYAMLAGTPPFAATAFERVVAMHLSEPPAPIDGLPVWLTAVIDRALAKTPEQRFKDARAFAKALEAPRARAEIVDEPPPPPPPKSRMPLIAGIIGVALALGLVALALAMKMRHTAPVAAGDAPIAIDAPTTAEQSLAIAHRASAEGNYAFAIAAYADAFKLAPTPALAKEIAELAVASHHNADAASYYREYLRLAPDAPDKVAIAETIANLDAVLDAGIALDAGVDAPAELPIDAAQKDPNGMPIAPLGPPAMDCRCESNGARLCKTNTESRCSCFASIDALCPGPMAGDTCPKDPTFASFTQLGHHGGEACLGYKRGDTSARTGAYECRVCADYDAFVFHGQSGDECNGFNKSTGHAAPGRLVCRANH